MRTDNWMLGICAGTAFCVVSLILIVIVVGESCGGIERTDYVGSLDEVFASHFTRVEQLTSPEDGATAVIESPYGVCDYWLSPWERALNLLAVFVALSISGALGARLGSTISPLRGAVASALGCLLLSVWAVAENWNQSPEGLGAVVMISIIALTAGAIGCVGGYLVLIRVRKAEAGRIRAGAP